MISRRVIETLRNIVGPEHLRLDPSDFEAYATDGTKLRFMPDAVIFPGNAQEVSAILIQADQERFPVIPRGAGTGMSGGALPVAGGLVLSLERFDRILLIDEDNLIAKVEPGVITAHLQAEVEKRALFYPPDPASSDISTIGGNVAECAGGLRAVKYGVTRDYILGLTAVLPTGEILKTGVETMKGVVGYDLTRLLIGSEGTLAVVTEITVRLMPRPETQRTMIAFFPEVAQAVETVGRIIRRGVLPSTLELMDSRSIACVRDEIALEVPEGTEALLLIEVDGGREEVDRDALRVRQVCEMSGVSGFLAADDRAGAETLWEARRNLSPSLYKLRPHKVSEDIVVPRSRMAELVKFLDAMSRRYGLPIPAFGHAGDGNLHVNIMLDKTDPLECSKAEEIVKALFQKVIAMGGTLSGEHGIGITKARYLGMEISPAGIALMQRIKNAFDPHGILNPGKMMI